MVLTDSVKEKNGGLSKHLAESPPKMEFKTGSYIEQVKKSINDRVNWKNAQAIMITFKPSMESLSRVYLRKWVKVILKSIMKETVGSPKVWLLYELSEIGRFHYHGITSGFPVDKLAEVKRSLRKHFGICEIKNIKNTTNYVDYIFKRYTTDNYLYQVVEPRYDILVHKIPQSLEQSPDCHNAGFHHKNVEDYFE